MRGYFCLPMRCATACCWDWRHNKQKTQTEDREDMIRGQSYNPVLLLALVNQKCLSFSSASAAAGNMLALFISVDKIIKCVFTIQEKICWNFPRFKQKSSNLYCFPFRDICIWILNFIPLSQTILRDARLRICYGYVYIVYQKIISTNYFKKVFAGHNLVLLIQYLIKCYHHIRKRNIMYNEWWIIVNVNWF